MKRLLEQFSPPLRALAFAGALLSASACADTLAGAGSAAAAKPPVPNDAHSIVLGMGCFWGAEKRMSALPGVVDVISGYAGGEDANPTYQGVLRNERVGAGVNHAEVVKVVYDPTRISTEQVLIGFWENHDPTQGERQGNDWGSNYRSAVFYADEAQHRAAARTRERYQQALGHAGYGPITTEIAPLQAFYPAEEYHQDYLVKNPKGYCGLGGTGVRYPAHE